MFGDLPDALFLNFFSNIENGTTFSSPCKTIKEKTHSQKLYEKGTAVLSSVDVKNSDCVGGRCDQSN